MITMRFQTYCRNCDTDLGTTAAIVQVMSDGTLKLNYPEELSTANSHVITYPDGMLDVLCDGCHSGELVSQAMQQRG